MANKQHLYDMVDKIINKKGDDAARVDFHSYAREKMRELINKKPDSVSTEHETDSKE